MDQQRPRLAEQTEELLSKSRARRSTSPYLDRSKAGEKDQVGHCMYKILNSFASANARYVHDSLSTSRAMKCFALRGHLLANPVSLWMIVGLERASERHCIMLRW